MTADTASRASTMPVATPFHDDVIGEPPPLTKIEKPARSSPSPSNSSDHRSQPDYTTVKRERRSSSVEVRHSNSVHSTAQTYQTPYAQASLQGKAVVHKNVRVSPYHVPTSPTWVAATTQSYIPYTQGWVKVQPQASVLLPAPTAAIPTACVIQPYAKACHPAEMTARSIANRPVLQSAPVVSMPLSNAQPPRGLFYTLARQEERQTHSPDSGIGIEESGVRLIDFNDGFSSTRAKELQAQIPNDPLSQVLPTGEVIFTCQPCQMSFKWRRHLEQHFLVHRCQDKPALCHICGKCFTRADHLNRHCATHEASKLTCQLCGANFHRASHLDKHWRTVHPHGQLIYRGQLASTTSSASDDSCSSGDEKISEVGSPTQISQREQSRETFLARLLQPAQHSTSRPSLPIDISRSIALKKGVRGAPYLPRRFGCHVCGRRFARSAHLHRHQRIHTGEKPFRCFQCGRSYARGDYLRAHLTMQHNQTELDCEVCSKTFTTISALNEHQRTEHGRMRAWYLQPGATHPGKKQLTVEGKENEVNDDTFSDNGSNDGSSEMSDVPSEVHAQVFSAHDASANN